MYRILLVDDHSLVRDGIKSLLESQADIQVVGESSNGQDAIEMITKLMPDLVICDIRMPVKTGIEVVSELSGTATTTKFIMLSMHDSKEYILKSIAAGAHGYLLKDTGKEEFLKAIYSVLKGVKYFSGDVSNAIIDKLLDSKFNSSDSSLNSANLNNGASFQNKEEPHVNFNLTKREKQVLKKAVAGLSNRDIAEELGVSKRTTEVHRFNLMKKLNVKNILDLSNKAKKYGLLDD